MTICFILMFLVIKVKPKVVGVLDCFSCASVCVCACVCETDSHSSE